MGGPAMRGFVSIGLLVLMPFSLFAADTNAAMLYTHGAAWINGAHVLSSSSAIFSGDLLQTRSDSVANIDEPGSSISVQSDSLVKFEGPSVRIEHGSVTVSTSKGTATSAGDVKVSPATNAWTEFNVTDVDGTVRIAARKGDLKIDDGRETVTLAQGQETSRDETTPSTDKAKKSKKRGTAAPPAAAGGALNSPWAIGAGGAAIVGLTTWVLVKNDQPASPATP